MRKNEEDALRVRIANADSAARVRLADLQDERDDLLARAEGMRSQIVTALARLDAVEARAATLQQTVTTLQQAVASLTPPVTPPVTTPPGQVT